MSDINNNNDIMNKITNFFDIDKIKKYIPIWPNLNTLIDWAQFVCICFGQNQVNELNQIELYPAIRSCKINQSDNITEMVPVNEMSAESIYDLNSDTESVIEEMIQKISQERIVINPTYLTSPVDPISQIRSSDMITPANSFDVITPINSVVSIDKKDQFESEPISTSINSTEDLNNDNNNNNDNSNDDVNNSNVTIKQFAAELIDKIIDETVDEAAHEIISCDMIGKINAEILELENEDWKNDIKVILDYDDCDSHSANSSGTPKSSSSEYELV